VEQRADVAKICKYYVDIAKTKNCCRTTKSRRTGSVAEIGDGASPKRLAHASQHGQTLMKKHRTPSTIAVALGLVAIPSVSEAANAQMCEHLWTLLDQYIAIMKHEQVKPGFTPAYKSATRQGLATGQQILAQGCPVTDSDTFEQELKVIETLTQMQND
jgi:hypothetical protein